MHHRHHNHCIKIVPFNQADHDNYFKHLTLCYICTHTARFKEFGTLVKQSTHVSLSSEHVFLA